jgi:hypothetical protein
MNSGIQDSDIRRLLDRAEISDVLGRYGYGMDSHDWDMVRSCWTETVKLDFTELDLWDEPLESISGDGWTRVLEAFFEDLGGSQHINTPVFYEFEDDDHALVVAILHAKHWMPNESGDPLQTVVGYYRHELLRTEAGWKISGMKETVHFNEGNSHVLDHCIEKMFKVLKQEAN